MILQWKAFFINLDTFNQYLIDNVPNADGINACVDNFEVVERVPLTEVDQQLIISYYDSLQPPPPPEE